MNIYPEEECQVRGNTCYLDAKHGQG